MPTQSAVRLNVAQDRLLHNPPTRTVKVKLETGQSQSAEDSCVSQLKSGFHSGHPEQADA
jgi:hypothetical protein